MGSTVLRAAGGRGRPVVTTHEAIERVAFELFADRGFEGTTVSDIAEAVGVGRRTLSNYYPSKNDIPWGQFDATLERFSLLLEAMPHSLPLQVAVRRGIVAFNDFPEDSRPSHRDRMRLILTTPELQAHSVHRYEAWRSVIARYVAGRVRQPETSALPQLVGRVSLAIALTSYEQWLQSEDQQLLEVLDRSFRALEDYLGR